MAEPFYLYPRRHGGNIYVQYRLPDGSLTVGKSTGTTNYAEAEKIAMREYSTGEYKRYVNSKLKSDKTETAEMLQWKKQLKTLEFSTEDVQSIVDVLIERKLLVSGVVTASKESELVIPFLLEFWDYDNSPYRKERARLGKELSYTYFETAFGRIKKYWVPRLEGKHIGEVTPDDIAAIYDDPKVQNLSRKTIKDIVNIMVIAMTWAHQKHKTQISNFDDIPKIAAGKPKKKEILRPEHVTKLFEVPWDNNMCRLANLLAMYTGMRASEVQALRVCDIHENYIWISHAWDDHIGLKTPKNGEERPVPISKELRESLLNMATFNPRYTKDRENSFVFFGLTGEKPVSQRGFNKFLQRALGESGYSDPRKIGFHCWRHGYCTQTQTIVHDDRMIREVSGHKSAEVFNHYADHLEMMDTINMMGNVAQQLFGDIVAKTLSRPVMEF